MTIARWWSVIASLGLLVVIQGCGGSGASNAEFSLVGGETLADSQVFSFALAGDDVTEDAPTLVVKAGEEVTITMENTHGQYSRTTGTHDLAVVPKLEDIATLAATDALADHVLWGAVGPKIWSGESIEIAFVPDTPGTYYYLCTIPGHASGGMMGELVVEEAD